MRRLALLAILLWMPAASVEAQEVSGAVLRVTGHGCQGPDRIQSGFMAMVDGEAGVVTTLHGVVGCSSVVADGTGWRAEGLDIARVDVGRDVAFLTGDTLRGARLERGPPGKGARPGLETVAVRSILPDDVRSAVADRRSPSLQTLVLAWPTAEGPPDFGAPVVDAAGSIVGVENGVHAAVGLIAWIVPYRDIQWMPPVQNETEMDRLATLSTAPLW